MFCFQIDVLLLQTKMSKTTNTNLVNMLLKHRTVVILVCDANLKKGLFSKAVFIDTPAI